MRSSAGGRLTPPLISAQSQATERVFWSRTYRNDARHRQKDEKRTGGGQRGRNVVCAVLARAEVQLGCSAFGRHRSLQRASTLASSSSPTTPSVQPTRNFRTIEYPQYWMSGASLSPGTCGQTAAPTALVFSLALLLTVFSPALQNPGPLFLFPYAPSR